MSQPGPSLQSLTRRLAECPPIFLSEPRLGPKGGAVVVEAVIADVLVELGGTPPPWLDLKPFIARGPQDRERLRLALLVCWLLADPALLAHSQQRGGALAAPATKLLATGLNSLATLVPPERFVSDPDRREELVRLTLRALDLRPEGESEAYAADRLKALDSVERERILGDTRAQVERARKLREAMAKKAAEEAAARYSGE